MAVENKYVDTLVAGGKLANASNFHGGSTRKAINTEELLAADDNLSVYRYFRAPGTWLVLALTGMHDAVTSGTDWDAGLYKPSVGGVIGAVVDKDIFADGVDISSASRTTDFLQTVNVADMTKMIFEHAADTESTKDADYDIALTANVVGSAAVTVTLVGEFVEG